MSHRQPPLFHVLLLASIAMRIVFGAPCCLSDIDRHELGADAAVAEYSAAMHHQMSSAGQTAELSGAGHDLHGENAGKTNPCCSACGPVLGGEPPKMAAAEAGFQTYAAMVLPHMSPRDLIRQYEATGPPVRV